MGDASATCLGGGVLGTRLRRLSGRGEQEGPRVPSISYPVPGGIRGRPLYVPPTAVMGMAIYEVRRVNDNG